MIYSECVSVALATQHVNRLNGESVVGITTRYRPDGPGIESRCETRFSAPFHTSPVAHPSSCTMGTRSPSRGIKQPGRGVDHPFPSSAEVKERVYPNIYSPSVPPWPILGYTPSSVAFPALSHFLPHYVINGMLLGGGGGIIENKSCFDSICNFLLKHAHSKINVAIYNKCTQVLVIPVTL
jgi:hypothetical protein